MSITPSISGMRRPHPWSVLLLPLLLATLLSCAVNPVTGKRQLMLISTDREVEIGREADGDIIASYGLYPDESLASYIETLGRPMGRDSHRPELEFSFKVLDSPVINAFALPGGYVYVTRGILPYLGSEAELAGILGHEIGHITARHSAARMSRAQIASLGLGIGSVVSETFSRYSRVAEAGVGLLMLGFSRKDEEEADRLGVEYATKQGYAAAEMSNFFTTLERMSPKQGGGLPDWFSTHPAPEKRVEKIGETAGEWRDRLALPILKVNRDQYLDRIDGIVFGPDPRQGYVLEGVFYHPVLHFQFPLPEGWSVQNEASQVQVSSPDQKAAILFTLGSQETPSEEAAAFISEMQLTPIADEGTTVNGLPARRVVADLEQESGTLRLLSYFILKGDQVYVFHGLCEKDRSDTYSETFRITMEGFDQLTDPERINVQPDRLRIRSVPDTVTLREYLLSAGVPEQRLEQLSLINGMELDDLVAAGTRVKIIEYR